MSKKGFQAFAAGMIVATSVLGGTYLLSGNQQAAEAGTEQELSENEVEKFLTSKQQTAISIDEYEELLATKNAEVTEEAPKEKTTDTTQATEKTEEKKEEVIKYNVTIKAGMTTSEVSDLLEQNGIISDSFEFDQYLIKNNYHTKVQLGTFEVQKGMSHNQLAEAITR
ncbi:endolytic transglycosylase MltG [Metabacillus schmidteae]|uniref:endolytic transglycosylase MltG n=1 Tax=Metabacillus schmidteae TaxID=2730405 RepID=UPI00158DEB8D|nr:endolytic transglycosylase MltG [Metabacillus schmidteae]